MPRPITALVAAAALSIVPAATASAENAPGRVIVKYAPSASPTLRGNIEKAAGVVGRLGSIAGLGAEVLRIAGDPQAAADRLNRSSAVLYAEPDRVMHATAIPNDPLFAQQYPLNNANDADMDAPEGWDLGGLGAFPAGGGPLVGIVDTGIDLNHEDLVGKTAVCAGVKNFGILLGLFADPTIVSGKCVDDNDHGTHVSGTVAAIANNAKGIAGVAFNSRIAMCKALDSGGSGPVSGIANCITFLHNSGAKVISMSLGGGSSTTLQQAVQNAYANGSGTLLVAAAGNDSDSSVEYPAGYPEVVSVAATDSNDQHASFSNTNADVEVSAAGVDVLSTKRGGGYFTLSGTSMATPHAAGVAADIFFRNPTWTAAQVRSKLDSAVDDLGAPGRDPLYGFGRVNLALAMQ
jgi:thermitase